MKRRLFRPLVGAVVDVLYTVLHQGAFAAPAIAAKLTENKKWGSRDRSFIVETTQDIFRHLRLLAEAVETDVADTNMNKLPYVVAAWWLKQGNELPPWDEWAHLDADKIRHRLHHPATPAAALSLPNWLYDLAKADMGDHFPAEFEAMQQSASLFIRVNTSRISMQAMQQMLAKDDVETQLVPGAPVALLLSQKKHLKNIAAFKEGLFEIQDAGSQLIAPYLQAAPGMLVVDACAGAGGKSLHLADIMQNSGHIHAFDITEVKLKNLRSRLRRSGFSNVQAKVVNDGLVDSLYQKADRLLLDVPCSGLGVLKRNPDTKWNLDADMLHEIRQTQRGILPDYHTMLKPGGKLVYATCSVLPSENEQQVQWFLSEYPEYQLEAEQYVRPSVTGFDGFFMARLLKQA